MNFLELLGELGGDFGDAHAAAGLVEVLVEGQELADARARDGGDVGEVEVGVAQARARDNACCEGQCSVQSKMAV